MVARIATYTFTGDAQELGKRAEAGILPILKAQPGFKSYTVAIGEGKVFSSSGWDSRDEAERGNAAVAAWPRSAWKAMFITPTSPSARLSGFPPPRGHRFAWLRPTLGHGTRSDAGLALAHASGTSPY